MVFVHQGLPSPEWLFEFIFIKFQWVEPGALLQCSQTSSNPSPSTGMLETHLRPGHICRFGIFSAIGRPENGAGPRTAPSEAFLEKPPDFPESY